LTGADSSAHDERHTSAADHEFRVVSMDRNVMTDPEVSAQSPGPAAAEGAGHLPGPGNAHEPASAAPRRRRRWALLALAAVLVAGLVAGLVVWAPWTPPPVLRPAGLVAGPSAATSVTFRWSPPRTGPPPDQYLIMNAGGAKIGSVAGTVTSYRQTGLNPATPYQYSVVAVRGGKRSPASAPLTVSTITPPIAQARLQGSWNVYIQNVRPKRGGQNGSLTWQFSPACTAGACAVTLRGGDGVHRFTMKLARAGASYAGQTKTLLYPCGSGASAINSPATLKIRIHITKAIGANQIWAAASWDGTMVGIYPYISSATFYCPSTSFKASLTGTLT
jgi:Fibronectin type III domain